MRVVLVHGTMDRAASFAKVLPHLRDCDVVTYDRRGYGHARAEPPTSLDDHVDDLEERLDGLPSVIIGHSIGADIALAVAARQPELVTAVGAWEAPLAWLPWWPDDSAGSRAAADGVEAGVAAEIFMRGVVGDDVWDRLPEATKQARRDEGVAMLVDIAGIRDDAPFDAARVTVPVVAGRGGDSKPYHRRSAEWLVGQLSNAELFEIPGARHGAHASHPAEFAAFVRRTIERARS